MRFSLCLFCWILWQGGAAVCAQDRQEQPAADYSLYYEFGAWFYHLETLEKFPHSSVDYPAQTWKYAGLYAWRYQNLVIDKIGFRGKLYEIIPSNGLKMTDLALQSALILPNKESTAQSSGQNFLITCSDGVLYVKHLEKDLGFRVYKYDATGSELFGAAVPHSLLIDRGNGFRYYRPYMSYFAHTARHLVFTSYDSLVPKTCLLNTQNGKVSEYDFSIQGLIRDAQETEILGFVRCNSDEKSTTIVYAEGEPLRLETPLPIPINRVETLLADGSLCLAFYNHHHKGCELWVWDLEAKRWRWKRSLSELAPATPGTYHYNSVRMSRHDQRLVVEGAERGKRYLYVLDWKSGRVLLSDE